MIGVVPLVKGDGCLGPSELHRGSKVVDGIHLLLGDAALPVGLIHLGALKDHGELVVFFLGNVH